jgi:phosphopantetheinyl transferase
MRAFLKCKGTGLTIRLVFFNFLPLSQITILAKETHGPVIHHL